MKVALLAVVLGSLAPAGPGGAAWALEAVRWDALHPEKEDILRFEAFESVEPGRKFGKFVIGGWPAKAKEPPPVPGMPLVVTRGMVQNYEWANAYLLRVNPGGYAWLTNPAPAGFQAKYNLGRGPILVSFEKPVCLFGAKYAQTGAHNPWHPELRRRTTFTFYDEDGALIGRDDQTPGYFLTEAAVQKQDFEPEIAAVVVDSDVGFALFELIAIPCSDLVS